MATIKLFSKEVTTEFYCDFDADSGVRRVIEKVISDYTDITGEEKTVNETADPLYENAPFKIFAGIKGSSAVLSSLEKEESLDLADIDGKREVYKYTLLKNTLIVAGSDKLGAIYGLFSLSEAFGVSPFKYWADSYVPKKKELEIDIDFKPSKEPSVKYRGLFINDEWPCFGTWTFDKFKGFTAEMYDKVFELLLRLKGNYLWPAMWSSSFALDGPGLENYRLATEYGITVGNSHHEPCLRAGEEYSKVRGKDSIYGDAWNFRSNREGITRFWEDSLMERGCFDTMVTVGMRGEADSKILGEEATLKDNIDLLKDVITCQNRLIKKAEEKFNKKFPKILALYKEVEPFFYGDQETEGLTDFEELEDVTLMLCDDNYGYLRTLPEGKLAGHKAGFGMYYHVDYHGAPISYEWINSSPLPVMWEQMSMAYDKGVREVWVCNVGDLKHNEFPLSYFLSLAYDFEKYGSSAPNTTFEYTKDVIDLHFSHSLRSEEIKMAAEILTETVNLAGFRRPEALNPSTYSVTHFDETGRIFCRAFELEEKMHKFESNLNPKQFEAWYSLSGFQTRALVTLVKMHMYAAKNLLFARQDLKEANKYADLTGRMISEDKCLKEEWASFKDGKWKGHELEAHVGFTSWNEDGAKYPLKVYVEPFDKPRLYVSRVDDEKVYHKVFGPCQRIEIRDFEYAGVDGVHIRLSNNGIGKLHVKVKLDEDSFIEVSDTELEFEDSRLLSFYLKEKKLTAETVKTSAYITDGETTVAIDFTACLNEATEDAFYETPYGFSLMASDYALKTEPKGIKLIELKNYGVFGSGMKAFPIADSYKGKAPSLTYRLYVKEANEYTFEADFAPTNPLTSDNLLRFSVEANGVLSAYDVVDKSYKAGEWSDKTWADGALNHRHTVKGKVSLVQGINEITVFLTDPGLVFEKLSLYRETPPESYFGMNLSIKGRKG